ncbi:hypothetical protein [Sedimenticola selenatireducens]|uniref:DUF8082 domain-containing protein n=1 Tax=Sedimenticola selenatireducens TaxID=191960 RepID=A0A557RZD2_9GAMM|nr:hypothetical protein [Sedimenticola selenatireducens]TVO70501.1 hypothetical protein FHP88_16575 [Sedimenticola selenatireducens]TVT63078.1 MAG: hypothetical protein FHK78_12950 [Sedimenticola selenatireducens]
MPQQTNQTLQGLVSLIKRHCLENDTGTLFLITEKSATIKLVIDEGDIIALSYQSIRGSDALLPISQLRSCKTRFYKGVKLLPTTQKLPSTDVILDELEGITYNQDTTQFLPLQQNTVDAAKGVGHALQSVLAIVIEETTEFMGPFASVLCKKYMGELSDPPTQDQIHTVLSHLAKDIRDEEKSMQLERNIMLRLK